MKEKQVKKVVKFAKKHTPEANSIPAFLCCKAGEPCIYFGGDPPDRLHAGLPAGVDGHVLVIGGSGTGKTSGIVRPTLETWGGPMVVLDIKGDLSASYAALYADGKATRPYMVFDPTDPNGPSYDPFDWLEKDNSDKHFVSNLTDLALTLVPDQPNAPDPFWNRSERGIVEAGLNHFYQLGLSFPQAVSMMLKKGTADLVKEFKASTDPLVQAQVSELGDLKPETLSSIGQGVKNHLRHLALDPLLAHTLRGRREGANCFRWEDVANYNIFLRIPSERLEAWEPMVRLMLTQLLRGLERREEKYGRDAGNNQILILLDEFPRLGKLLLLANAAATLRSKGVTILLVAQSLAQLDQTYGVFERRVIADNCAYTAFLGANDTDTQEYFAKRIGTVIRPALSVSEQKDSDGEVVGLTKSVSEKRELFIQPHELAGLDNVLILSPHGMCKVEKYKPYNKSKAVWKHTTFVNSDASYRDNPGNCFRNENAQVMGFSDRCNEAEGRLVQNRQAEHERRAADEKNSKRRRYELGGMLLNARPELQTAEGYNQYIDQLNQLLAQLPAFREFQEEVR